jgi:superfamily II DNA/RNA helicase
MHTAELSAAEQKASKAAFKELGVCDELCDAAVQMRWKMPSEIQREAIPPLLEGAPPPLPSNMESAGST